jgi:hypothetical protein
LELFKKTNSHLNTVYELSYKYDNKRIEEVFGETKVLCEDLFNKNSRVAFFLFFIARDIRNLLPFLIEINM